MQYSTAIRDAQSDAIARTVGAAPVLEVWSGAMPPNCAALDAGALLAVGTLPQEWMGRSENGAVSLAGSWQLLGQIGAGLGKRGSYFRIKQAGMCHLQGTYGEGMEMVADVATIANGQSVTVQIFTLTRGNA